MNGANEHIGLPRVATTRRDSGGGEVETPLAHGGSPRSLGWRGLRQSSSPASAEHPCGLTLDQVRNPVTITCPQCVDLTEPVIRQRHSGRSYPWTCPMCKGQKVTQAYWATSWVEQARPRNHLLVTVSTNLAEQACIANMIFMLGQLTEPIGSRCLRCSMILGDLGQSGSETGPPGG